VSTLTVDSLLLTSLFEHHSHFFLAVSSILDPELGDPQDMDDSERSDTSLKFACLQEYVENVLKKRREHNSCSFSEDEISVSEIPEKVIVQSGKRWTSSVSTLSDSQEITTVSSTEKAVRNRPTRFPSDEAVARRDRDNKAGESRCSTLKGSGSRHTRQGSDSSDCALVTQPDWCKNDSISSARHQEMPQIQERQIRPRVLPQKSWTSRSGDDRPASLLRPTCRRQSSRTLLSQRRQVTREYSKSPQLRRTSCSRGRDADPATTREANYMYPRKSPRNLPARLASDLSSRSSCSSGDKKLPATSNQAPMKRISSDHGGEVLIEIFPGVREPLRRASETVEAVAVGFYSSVYCMACGALDLHAISDVQYFVCPTCRTVCPVEGDCIFLGRRLPRHGLGLGFDTENLVSMQAQTRR